ncbi:hypothetical protein [Melittangium boletus]|uniref:Uncharacterized protein n=1 Tax=Melittangium boletus DSM 14713 TaxID=1294270 RepID=A0A286NVA5_9BACT|nr:hypothetical protein [Melittangium boletus]ATB27044.1 hypothetical protein MEBOL_000479 [Melittangium boletus DSM 14713]
MDLRIKNSVPSRLPTLEPTAPRANALPPQTPATPGLSRPVDTFTPALQRSANVALAPAANPAQVMRDYLTGALPPPADFEKVMGYKPVLLQTPHGPRMQDPLGYASSPGGIGPVEDFDVMAKTHDYGYDLLRYHARVGQPLGPEARKAADAQFREDLFQHANDKPGLVERWKSRTWAQIFSVAVELNSRVQNYAAP